MKNTLELEIRKIKVSENVIIFNNLYNILHALRCLAYIVDIKFFSQFNKIKKSQGI